MSKPVTTAPRRLAVAIACRPATPAPSTSTFAGRDGAGGRGHHREEAARLARGEQRRRVAGDVGLRGERVHRLRAGDPRDRLHREAGHARRAASALLVSAEVSGARRPIRTWPCRSLPISSARGHGDVDDDVGAPGVARSRRRPRCTRSRDGRTPRRRRTRPRRRAPCSASDVTTSGISATRRSALSGFFWDTDLHPQESGRGA